MCLQESKLREVDDFLVKSVCGNSCFGYSFQPSVGGSGGLLTCWDPSVVEVWCTINYIHVLIIKGKVILTSQDFIIANVYAPCDLYAKQELWVRLNQFILENGDVNFCICGDFNSVRMATKRKGRSEIFRRWMQTTLIILLMVVFLLDLSLCGRLFT